MVVNVVEFRELNLCRVEFIHKFGWFRCSLLLIVSIRGARGECFTSFPHCLRLSSRRAPTLKHSPAFMFDGGRLTHAKP